MSCYMPCHISRHFIYHVMSYNMLYVMSFDMSCRMSYHVMLFYMAWQMSDHISCYISSHILCHMSCHVRSYVVSSHICHVLSCYMSSASMRKFLFGFDYIRLRYSLRKSYPRVGVGGGWVVWFILGIDMGRRPTKMSLQSLTHNFYSRATVHIVGCVAPYLHEYFARVDIEA